MSRFSARRIRQAIPMSSLVLLLVGAQPAHAQSQTETYTVEEALRICARVKDPADRLACFEELARSAAPDARSDKPAQGAEAAAAGKSRYVVFRAEEHAKEGRTAGEPEKRRREPYGAVVLRGWARGDGEYFIALANGEVWKSQAQDRPRPVRDGEEVTLKPGGMGGWFMEFKTLRRPTIKVTLAR